MESLEGLGGQIRGYGVVGVVGQLERGFAQGTPGRHHGGLATRPEHQKDGEVATTGPTSWGSAPAALAIRPPDLEGAQGGQPAVGQIPLQEADGAITIAGEANTMIQSRLGCSVGSEWDPA